MSYLVVQKRCYFWAMELFTLGIVDWTVSVNGVAGGCGVFFAENMSSRSGHVDVSERRLRPIYGQCTFTVITIILE